MTMSRWYTRYVMHAACRRFGNLAVIAALLSAPVVIQANEGALEARREAHQESVADPSNRRGSPRAEPRGDRGERPLPPESEARLRVFVHEEPKPSHRTPRCTATTNDTVGTYAETGWHLPTDGLTYAVNVASAPGAIEGSVVAALERAAATWTDADADKILSFGGTSTATRPRYNGENSILWRKLRSGVLALAYVWWHPTTGEVLDADMVFNLRVPWAVNDPASGDCGGVPTAYDFQAIATHEFGHWDGLDDLYGTGEIDLTMYGFATLGELKKVSLGTGDTLGAQAIAP